MAESSDISGTRLQAERALLGALLTAAEEGTRVPPVDLRADELRSPYAAATYQLIHRLPRNNGRIDRQELIAALVEHHGAHLSDAAAYLRGLRADTPNQWWLKEWVRRIRDDEEPRLADAGPPAADSG